MASTLELELKDHIRSHGPITFERFMHMCLYSPLGGFYASRHVSIGAHFGTSPMSHPAFGTLLARQLAQMWRLLDEPETFHVIEPGCGDGVLARSILRAVECEHPRFARSLYYVAADYVPYSLQLAGHGIDGSGTAAGVEPAHVAAAAAASERFRRVRTAGVGAFRNLVGCILSNELLDNHPVHRFVVRNGRLREIGVALANDAFVEVDVEPSSPCIEARLVELGVQLVEGQRGEVCLGLEDWIRSAAAALDRGFVLTIDYGEQAPFLYAPANAEGTLVCYHEHTALADPYRHIGRQDITCHVDFTTLMRLGERHGLATAGYTRQCEFLRNLGFDGLLEAVSAEGLTAARAEFGRIAMMTLVDPSEYGDFKVLAQCKGLPPQRCLQGFGGTPA